MHSAFTPQTAQHFIFKDTPPQHTHVHPNTTGVLMKFSSQELWILVGLLIHYFNVKRMLSLKDRSTIY